MRPLTLTLTLTLTMLALTSASAHAQGRGGGNPGTPGLALPATDPYMLINSRVLSFALTDLDLTAITRMDEQLEKQKDAVTVARTAMLAATFSTTKNPADLAAKVAALATAEQALALARAEAWQKLQAEQKFTPEKIVAIRRTMSATVVGGGAGGVAP